MVRSELTTTSIETGKTYTGKLYYDPRTGQAFVREGEGFFIPGFGDLLDKQGNWTSLADRHLDAATKESWKKIIAKDIVSTYNKAGGESKKMKLPWWVRQTTDVVDPPPEFDKDIPEGSLDPRDVEGLADLFKGKQKTDNLLQRLSLKNLKYPLDADYGNTQDYIQINQFTYKATNPQLLFPTQTRAAVEGRDYTKGKKNPPKVVTDYYAGAGSTLLKGVYSESPKEIPLGLVKLPMPNQLNDSNNVAWGEDQLNAITAAASTLAAGGFQGALDFVDDIQKGEFKNTFDIIGRIFNNIGGAGEGIGDFIKQASQNPNAQLNARSVIGSSLLNLVGFGVSPEAILARGAGVIPNNNLQLLFNAPALRAFRFDWKMSPRSQEEAIRINNIIRFFKQGMAAKKMRETGGRSYFLGTPNIFDITFKTSKESREITNTNHSVLKIKTCACVGAAVNYTPEGMWNAYEKGQPTSCILSLQFKELEPLYNTDYEEDPFEFEDLTGYVPENAIGY